MSPYGAGLEGQALGNFNIDWQNQQLGRQTQGLHALLGGQQQAGQDFSGALQAYGQAPQNILQGGALPVQTGQQIGQMQTGAANQYAGGIGNALAPLAGIQSQIIPYLYAGQGAGSNAFGQYANQRNFDANQQQMGTQGLIQGLNAFGKANPTWVGGGYSPGSGASANQDAYGNMARQGGMYGTGANADGSNYSYM